MGALDDLGTPMTLRAMRASVDNPSPEAERTVNGTRPRTRLKALSERREQALEAERVRRCNRLAERATAGVEDADETLDLTTERIAGWVKAMSAGRLDPETVIDNIRQCPEVLTAITEVYDSAAKDAAAAAEFMEQDLADFEQDQLDRFSALADSLPRVTEAWLRGEDGAPDPLAEPKEADSAGVAEAAAAYARTARGGQRDQEDE